MLSSGAAPQGLGMCRRVAWSRGQPGGAGSEHPTGSAPPAKSPVDVPVHGNLHQVTTCVSQESHSPASDVLEPRRSAFEPAVSSQEKLDFNKNLKEGKKGFCDLPPGCFRKGLGWE